MGKTYSFVDGVPFADGVHVGWQGLEGKTLPATPGFQALVGVVDGPRHDHTPVPITSWHVRGGRARPVCKWGTLKPDTAIVRPDGWVIWRGSWFESLDHFNQARMGR